MKNVLILFLALALMYACQKESDNDPEADLQDIELAFQTAQSKSTCGQVSISWLQDLLIKAEEDRVSMKHKGNYIGIVSIVQYRESSLFYTNFMLGSGGIAFYLFDCDGVFFADISSEDYAFFNREGWKRQNIIYSSYPLE